MTFWQIEENNGIMWNGWGCYTDLNDAIAEAHKIISENIRLADLAIFRYDGDIEQTLESDWMSNTDPIMEWAP